MEQYIKKSAVVSELEDWRDKIKNGIFSIPLMGRDRADAAFEYEILGKVRDFLDTLEVKEVDLEKEINSWVNDLHTAPTFEELDKFAKHFFELGINAKVVDANLWHPADGDDLPELEREVIVLYQPYPLENNEYAVGFGHRPKEYWDGKNIDTCEVTRYYPKKYDKGGWNSPNIKWWLDLELPIKKGGEG